MATSSSLIILLCILVSLLLASSSQTCPKHKFTSNRVFNSCIELPSLHAHLHWNYFEVTKEVEIAFRAKQNSKGWVAWSINLNKTGMVGSQAIVAFHNSYDGSMTAYPTLLTSYSPSMLPEELSFSVSNLSAEYRNSEMTIFALLSPLTASFNHVWQVGSVVSDNIPQMHSMSIQNLQSTGHLNLLSS